MTSYQFTPGDGTTYLIGMDVQAHNQCTISTSDGSSVTWPTPPSILRCSEAGKSASSATFTALQTGYAQLTINAGAANATSFGIAVCYDTVEVALSTTGSAPVIIAMGVEDTRTVLVTGNGGTVTWTPVLGAAIASETEFTITNVGDSYYDGTQVIVTALGSGMASYQLVDSTNPSNVATIMLSMGHLLIKADDGNVYLVQAGEWVKAASIVRKVPGPVKKVIKSFGTTGVGTWLEPTGISTEDQATVANVFADDCTTCYVLDLSNIPIPKIKIPE